MSDDLSIPNAGYRGHQFGHYSSRRVGVRARMDPDTRRLVLFAGGLGSVLAILIGASALVQRHGGTVPVVSADARPVREKPLNPGGMKIDGADNDMFSGGSDTGNVKLSAASEAPDTKGLSAAALTPPPVTEAPPASATIAPPPVAATPLPVVTRPAVVASAPQAARPAVVTSTAPLAKPAPTKPPVASTETRSAAATHPAMVQLAAMTSEEAAHSEWKTLSKRMPDLLNGRQPSYQRVERDGHTLWRLRTTGFGNLTQAKSFCDHIRAKGAACSVAES